MSEVTEKSNHLAEKMIHKLSDFTLNMLKECDLMEKKDVVKVLEFNNKIIELFIDMFFTEEKTL